MKSIGLVCLLVHPGEMDETLPVAGPEGMLVMADLWAEIKSSHTRVDATC